MTDHWAELHRAPPQSVSVAGTNVRRGSRVRLHPRAHGDVLDRLLSDRIGVVESVDEALDGTIHLAVTVEGDPGRDLGDGRFPGHRFYFGLDEVEPLARDDPESPPPPRVLVAGIGNIFLGDDGFGSAVAEQLARRTLPPGADVRDFGIRGLDLAYAMQDEYDAVVMIDAAVRGEPPGTLFVIDAAGDAAGPAAIDTHGMDPVKVLALARALGRVPPRVLVVGCEPETVLAPDQWDEATMTLSQPVQAAVARAVGLVESLLEALSAESRTAAIGDRTAGGRDVPPANPASDLH